MTSKVLLINPEIPSLSKSASPLSLALLWIGSYLDQNGYKVKIVNVQDQENYLNTIKKEMKSSICVGITAMTVQVQNALKISDFIKENDSSIPIIWGGVHPYLFPESTVMDKSVDIVAIREAEHTILELVKHFENGISLNDIGGIAYINKNKEKIRRQP